MFLKKENLIIGIVFLFSTSFFIYQHSTGLSWDFSVYVLNAKHIFSDGKYFEWLRPPLTSFIIGIFSIFGWKSSEYIFIVFVSTLFLFSCIKISEKLNVPKEIYYISSMNFYTLIYSFMAGSELLSLSLLQLFIVYIDEWFSGVFLSLAFLTRYNNIIFLPLILFAKDKKKILCSLLCFSLTLLPWLAYNFLKTGDPFLSFTDFYFLNIKFRVDVKEQIRFDDFLFLTNFYLPLTLIGFIKFTKDKNKNFLIIILFFALSLAAYIASPFKNKRYLFNLIMPIGFFSSLAYNKKIKIIYFLIFLLSFFAALKYSEPLENPTIYEQAAAKLDKCETRSNAWVFMNYYDFYAGPLPWKHQIKDMVSNGTRFVIFKNIETGFSNDFWRQFPLIEENDKYFVVGNQSLCNKNTNYPNTYFDQISQAYGLNITRYEAIFIN